MIPSLVRREFGYGSGMISPNLLRFIINVPKNASSFINAWTEQFGWRANLHTVQEHRIAEAIVILRDPVDRWISGISQYLQGWILHARGTYDINQGPTPDQQYIDGTAFIHQYNAIVERLIFDNLERHDDHVWPQAEIISGVLENKRKQYFYLDDTLEDRLSMYLNIPKIPGLDRNSILTSTNGAILQNFFRERLREHPELELRVRQRYQKDYDLIARVIHD